MLQLTPQSRVFLAVEPADFRRGIDGLAALCRQRLGENPLDGAIFVFRNRRGTSLKLLCPDLPNITENASGFWTFAPSHFTEAYLPPQSAATFRLGSSRRAR
ncbi:MAG: IS66 family insertion sequence element accessory protein TnpB [Sulfitobacter sp.]|nr:IS66 family insertion sequence element accessory protein TnpB [Sulfitobacter sp.]